MKSPSFSKLTLGVHKKEYVLRYDSEILLRIKKDVLLKMLGDLGIGSPEPEQSPGINSKTVAAQLSKILKTDVSDYDVRVWAKQFARAYGVAKQKYYRSKNVFVEVSPRSKDYGHILRAVKICKTHKVTYKKFLQAQLDGLKFINNGRGIFPPLSNLSTDSAENRLLEFISNGSTSVDIKLSDEDKHLPLAKNLKYQTAIFKIGDNRASLKEAKYAAEVQRFKRGKVSEKIEKYIESFDE